MERDLALCPPQLEEAIMWDAAADAWAAGLELHLGQLRTKD